MFTYNSVQKTGTGLEHRTGVLSLTQSLRELFRLYEECGADPAGVPAALNARINRCAGDTGLAKYQVQQHLYVMLRARDLHAYVHRELELAPLKLQLLELILFYRGAAERWAAARELLLGSLDHICQSPLAGAAGNLERYKQALSHPGSRLGELLQTVALFNLDTDPEHPPANLRLRFESGRFPLSTWDLLDHRGKQQGQRAAAAWRPTHPLSRWEYLAADLIHALYRGRYDPATRPLLPGSPEGAGPDATAAGRVYCRLESAGADHAEATQLELLPVEPERFLPEVQRMVHRRLGGEGLRLFALLMQRLGTAQPRQTLTVRTGEVWGAPLDPPPTPRARRTHAKRLWALLNTLSRVELTRVTGAGDRSQIVSSRLLTVVSQGGDWPDAPPAPAGVAAPAARPGEACAEVLLDPLFHALPGTLSAAYRTLPAALTALPAPAHPFALALFVYLYRTWAAEGEAGQGRLVRGARALLAEAGLWTSDGTRYRTLEALKGDLHALRDLGLLGQWRLERGTSRDPLDDIYHLEAPRHAGTDRATAGASEGFAVSR